MRMMRFAVVAVLVLSMAGVVMAGGGREAAPAVDDGALRIAVVMPSATNDMAFSQSMWTALTAVQAEMGGPSALQLSYSENMFVVPDAAGALRDYASQGYDIVIGHGSQYGSSIQDIAPDFPDTVFAWGTDVNTFGLDNVYAYTAAAEQGGYVNGVLAALMTRSGQVGVTGPVEVGDAKTYIDGFVNGVRQTDSAVRVSQSWTGSFSDVAAMTAAASTHIANGADALTGSSQSVVGSVGVARESDGVLWFGTQADQTDLAPELVVASQIYDWTDMLREIIANRQAGRMGGESYILTFANDGLKMAFNPAIDIPAEAMEAALAAIEGIKNGQIRAMP